MTSYYFSQKMQDALESYISCRCWTNSVDESSMKKYCNEFIDILSNNFKVSQFSQLKPSHIISYFNQCSTPWKYVSYSAHFLKYLAENKHTTASFEYMTSRIGFPYIEKQLQISPDLFKEEGTVSADSLYSTIDSVKSVMKQFDYSQVAINIAVKGIKLYCLYLQEFNLKASIDSIYIWIKEIDRIIGRKCHFGVGIFFALKIATNEEISLDDYVHHIHRISERPLAFPKWARSWIDKYEDFRKLQCLHTEKSHIYRLISFLSQKNIVSFEQITPQLLIDFYLQDEHSTPGGNHASTLEVKKFLIFLAENKIIRFSVVAALPNNKSNSVRPVKILSQEQIDAIKEFCNSELNTKDSRLRVAFELALLAGLRQVDIVNLRLENISPDEMTLTFFQKKTKKQIKIPLPESVLNAICDYLETDRGNYENDRLLLGVNAPHAPIQHSIFQSYDKTKFNCSAFSMHMLRKTFATSLMNAGVNFQHIAELLGHSGMGTVHIYLSASETMLRDCCLSLDGIDSEVV